MSTRFNPLNSFWLDSLDDRMQASPYSPWKISIAAALISLVWTFGLGLAAEVLFPHIPHAGIFEMPQMSINLFNTLVLTPAIVFYFYWIPARGIGSAEKVEELGLVTDHPRKLSRILATAIRDRRISVFAMLTSLTLFLLMILWAWPLEAQHLNASSPFLLSPILYWLYSLWFLPLIYLLAGNVFRLLVIAHHHSRFFNPRNSLKKLQMFGEDKVGGIGTLGDFYIGVGWFATIFIFWGVCETVLLPLLAGYAPDPNFALWILFAYLFLFCTILVRGARAIHSAMTREKNAILRSHYKSLDDYNTRIAHFQEAPRQKVKLNELISVRKGLTDHISYLEKYLPVWPFNIPRVVFSWTLPPQAVAIAFFADLLDVMDFIRTTVLKN